MFNLNLIDEAWKYMKPEIKEPIEQDTNRLRLIGELEFDETENETLAGMLGEDFGVDLTTVETEHYKPGKDYKTLLEDGNELPHAGCVGLAFSKLPGLIDRHSRGVSAALHKWFTHTDDPEIQDRKSLRWIAPACLGHVWNQDGSLSPEKVMDGLAEMFSGEFSDEIRAYCEYMEETYG